jgi:hypothetical protein
MVRRKSALVPPQQWSLDAYGFNSSLSQYAISANYWPDRRIEETWTHLWLIETDGELLRQS